jgi:D-3-phosphoglycerate dehydrogenase
MGSKPQPHSPSIDERTARVLVVDAFASTGVEALRHLGCDVIHNPHLDAEGLVQACADLTPDVLVVREAPVSAAVFAACPNLGLVVRSGAGTETIDVEAANRNGVLVAHCPARGAIAAAELTWGLILAADRRIPAQTSDLQAGHWRHGHYAAAAGLAGRTLGVIGLGPVGQEVARRGLAFGMHVIAWSRHITEARCDALGIDLCANLVNLAKLSDVVSVNVPQRAETADMVGEKFFAALRPGAILVNTSRSGAIDEAALLRAVRTKRIRVASDSWDDAPEAAEGTFAGPLGREPGVIGTHGVAACTEQAMSAIADEVARIVSAWINDFDMPGCVNIAQSTGASTLLCVRHHNVPGVLAQVFAVLGNAKINVEEMDNIIYEGGYAAVARMQLSRRPSAEDLAAVRACNAVLAVNINILRGPRS